MHECLYEVLIESQLNNTKYEIISQLLVRLNKPNFPTKCNMHQRSPILSNTIHIRITPGPNSGQSIHLKPEERLLNGFSDFPFFTLDNMKLPARHLIILPGYDPPSSSQLPTS